MTTMSLSPYPPPAVQQRPARMSRNDVHLLAILATGIPVNAVADRIGVSDRTVRRRMRRICDVLDVSTPIEAVAWAARRRLI